MFNPKAEKWVSSVWNDNQTHMRVRNWWKRLKNYEFDFFAWRNGSRGVISPLKQAKVTLFTMIVCNSENSIRNKAILSFHCYVEQCCKVYFIPLTVAKTLWDLTTKYYCNRPQTLLAGFAPICMLKGSKRNGNDDNRWQACIELQHSNTRNDDR